MQFYKKIFKRIFMSLILELADSIKDIAPSLVDILRSPLQELFLRVLARELGTVPGDIQGIITILKRSPEWSKNILKDLERENKNLVSNLLMSFQEELSEL